MTDCIVSCCLLLTLHLLSFCYIIREPNISVLAEPLSKVKKIIRAPDISVLAEPLSKAKKIYIIRVPDISVLVEPLTFCERDLQ